MPKSIPLDKLPITDRATSETVVVIETPKASRNKYDYHSKLENLRLAAVLPEGMVFPFDFGFIPSTRAQDGDPLDIIVLLDEPVPPGCVVIVKIIGAIKAEQRNKGKDWIRNDRLLGVPVHAHLHGNVEHIRDLNSKILDELEAFFKNYNKAKGVEFRVLERSGPKEARDLVDEASVS